MRPTAYPVMSKGVIALLAVQGVRVICSIRCDDDPRNVRRQM